MNIRAIMDKQDAKQQGASKDKHLAGCDIESVENGFVVRLRFKAEGDDHSYCQPEEYVFETKAKAHEFLSSVLDDWSSMVRHEPDEEDDEPEEDEDE